ncbi:MAG: hypothetical protein QM749_05515 [Aquabacterium sp.]
MSVNKLRRLPLAAAALIACASAQADYTSPDGNFRMSGFGTLGAVRSSTDDAIFNYPGQGGGATKHGSLDPDSKIAVQGTYKFAPTVSATSQVMTKYDADGQYVPNIEWAFAKWQATPGLSVRAGRMGAPYFMISDFRDVGYANTTVRPNIDVYGQVPVSQFEGADLSYQMPLGSTTLTSTLWGGDSKAQYASSLTTTPTDVVIKRQVGLNFQLELTEGLTLRLGRSHGKLSINSTSGDQLIASARQLAVASAKYAAGAPTVAAGLSGLGQTARAAQVTNAIAGAQADAVGFNQIADTFTTEGVDASFTGIGLAYDQDNWVANAEFTKRKTKSFITDTTGWYGMVGYRIAKFTPYVGFSKIKTDRRSQNTIQSNALVATGTNSPTFAAFDGAAAAVNGNTPLLSASADALLSTQAHDQHTSTLGVRWDATSSLAIKAQLDHIIKPDSSSSGAGSVGWLLVADPTSANGRAFTYSKRTINVVTLSVDFVF